MRGEPGRSQVVADRVTAGPQSTRVNDGDSPDVITQQLGQFAEQIVANDNVVRRGSLDPDPSCVAHPRCSRISVAISSGVRLSVSTVSLATSS